MTESELERALAWATLVHDGSEPARFAVLTTTSDLVAEVRRLKALVKEAEFGADDVWNGESMGAVCVWCRELKPGHDADCVAFTPDGSVR